MLVAEFTYYGTGWMKSVHYDVDADGTVENTSHDPWYHYAYDDPGSWRMLAVFRDTDSVPKEAFVPHMAGMNGLGSSSKLDDVICRNKDANTAWATACDGTLEERIYQCQNWRGDVVARIDFLLTSAKPDRFIGDKAYSFSSSRDCSYPGAA